MSRRERQRRRAPQPRRPAPHHLPDLGVLVAAGLPSAGSAVRRLGRRRRHVRARPRATSSPSTRARARPSTRPTASASASSSPTSCARRSPRPRSRRRSRTRPSRSRTGASTSTRASTSRASCAPRSRTSSRGETVAGRLDADDAAHPQPLHTRTASQDASSARSARRSSPRSSRTATRAEGKKWVLMKYLNIVPYGTVGGQTAIGVQAASRIFFDKPASRADARTRPRCSPACPRRPSQYNPFHNAGKAPSAPQRGARPDGRAGDDHAGGHADEAHGAAARRARRNRYYTQRRESYFFDYVKQELINRYGVDEVRQGGLKVYTTIDLKLQQAARAAIAAARPPRPAVLGDRHDRPAQRLHPRDGRLRATTATSKFNLAAQGHRQPGSTFKVMVLMAALRRGRRPQSTQYTSQPLNFNDPTYGPIEVKTYSNSYIGPHRPRPGDAGVGQLRLPAARPRPRARQGPPDRLRHGHQDASSTPTRPRASAASSDGVSPLEMANAYATIASGGWRNRPNGDHASVDFPDGHVRQLVQARARTRRSATA